MEKKYLIFLIPLMFVVFIAPAHAYKLQITGNFAGLQQAPNFTTIVTLNNSVIGFNNDCSNIYFNNAAQTANLTFWRDTCKEDASGKSVFFVNWGNSTTNPYIFAHNDSAVDLSNTSVFQFFDGFENETVNTIPANAVDVVGNQFVKAVKNDVAASGTKSAYYNNQYSTGTGYKDMVGKIPSGGVPLIVTQTFRHNSTSQTNKCWNLYFSPTAGTGLASAALNPCTDSKVYLGDLIGFPTSLATINANTWYRTDYFVNYTETGNSSVYYLNGTKLNPTTATMFSRQTAIPTGGGFFEEQNGAGAVVTWSLDNIAVANGTSDLPSFTFTNVFTPTVTVTSPVDEFGYNTGNIDLNFTATDNPTSCWYILDAVNTSIPSCLNTNFSTTNGTHVLNVYASNSAGTGVSSTITFNVDTHNPVVNIFVPDDDAFLNSSNVTVQFTATNAVDVSACWYILNGGANTSINGCHNVTFANITITVTGTEGLNNITVYANDTADNIGFHSNDFTVDTVFPTVSIQNPTGLSGSSTVPLNYTASDIHLSSCSISTDYGFNATLIGCPNATLNGVPDGAHNVTVTAFDLANNSASATSPFTVDTTPPSVAIQSPSGTYASGTTSVALNFTASDLQSLDKCWYNLNGGVNTSLPSCSNTTLTNLTSGSYTLNVYANDSASNTGTASSTFTISSPVVPPKISGATANIIEFLPLIFGVGILVTVVRKIEDMQSTEDFVAVIIGTGLAIVFLGVFAAIIAGLI